MWLRGLAFALCLLTGCATARSAQQTVSWWFGVAEPRPRALYVGIARAKLHREPEASSEVVGELALYEGVLSYRVEDGFAYVRGKQSGRSGWVRTAELIDRLSAARRQVSKPTAEAPAAEPSSADRRSLRDRVAFINRNDIRVTVNTFEACTVVGSRAPWRRRRLARIRAGVTVSSSSRHRGHTRAAAPDLTC